MGICLDALTRMEYPGRMLIIGAEPTGKCAVVVYAITWRSPSSQARKLEIEGSAIYTKPTDPEALRKGNVDLLVYPALQLGRGVAVSNGKQTADIFAALAAGPTPAGILSKALENWDYEPDAPIYTPRISGCIVPGPRAALSVLRRDPDGSTVRNYFEFPLLPGRGKFVSTYAGKNADPLPVFNGEPVDVEIEASDAREAADAVYRALQPRPSRPDFRVAVAAVFADKRAAADFDVNIINRHERNE